MDHVIQEYYRTIPWNLHMANYSLFIDWNWRSNVSDQMKAIAMIGTHFDNQLFKYSFIVTCMMCWIFQ